jgi:hypothetical protein
LIIPPAASEATLCSGAHRGLLERERNLRIGPRRRERKVPRAFLGIIEQLRQPLMQTPALARAAAS